VLCIFLSLRKSPQKTFAKHAQKVAKHPQNTAKHRFYKNTRKNTAKHPQNTHPQNTAKTHLLTKQTELANKPLRSPTAPHPIHPTPAARVDMTSSACCIYIYMCVCSFIDAKRARSRHASRQAIHRPPTLLTSSFVFPPPPRAWFAASISAIAGSRERSGLLVVS